MKKYIITTIIIVIYFIIAFSFIGCTTTKYVPVEKIKTEYIKDFERDTIIVKDSVYLKKINDTIYIEKYKTLFKSKIQKDTIIKTDTIPIIKEVEVIKEVNKLKDWQIILMILGGGMVAIVGYKLLRMLKI